LGLLQRQKPEWKPDPGGDARRLAPQSVEETVEDNGSQVCFRLPAAGREEHNIDEFTFLGIRACYERRGTWDLTYDEDKLEESPRAILSLPKGLVREAERQPNVRVGHKLNASPEAADFVEELASVTLKLSQMT
jgi:hypothetical protein